MTIDSAIQHLKESLADPTHKWGCEECKQEHEQLLEWLEDYKRLQSVSSWHSCDEKPPERITYLVSDGYCVYFGFYDVFKHKWVTNEDTDGNSLLYWMEIPKPQQPKEVTP